MKPGPYQHCDECETERSHNWKDKEDIFVCVVCGKETKIKPRPAIPRETIFPGLGKITPTGTNEMDHIDQPLIDEINQGKKPVQEVAKKPVQKKEEGPTTFEPELPKMGHEIKATPLEDLKGKRTPGLIFEENGPFPIISEPQTDGKMYATEFIHEPEFNSSHRVIMMDTTEDPGPPFKEIDPKTHKFICSIDPINKNIEEGNIQIFKKDSEGNIEVIIDRVKPKPATGGWADAL